MNILTVITLLIIISATFSYLNERIIKLPGTIGVMTISVVVSLVLLIIGKVSDQKSGLIVSLASSIDFSKLLLDVMLGFLLFATALHFDYTKLKELKLAIVVLSTVGVILSTVVFGFLFFWICLLLNIDMPLIYCFLFGAIISPTDPIAVAAILKKSKIPPRLETIIAGESMFNDAIGLILFVVLLGISDGADANMSASFILSLFAHEVVGGIIIGLIVGYIGFRLIRSINDFQTIFLISVGLILGISLIAEKFDASVPLAAITSGLVIGNKSFGKNTDSQKFLNQIWRLIDEVLNTILFVMIGLQLILLPFIKNYWLIGVLSIFIILIARFLSVTLPALLLLGKKTNARNLFILTWAGLRGGISVAMALSLPSSHYKEIILSVCYLIVIFSVIVQGLTLNKLVERVTEKTAEHL
ncbi:MAG: sodium:proton antiporter [Bacteroidota bacterium]|nr:sodium:proton antiporter [Bacteroidota bacterium]